MLAVKFSDEDGGATVSANPAGVPCDRSSRDDAVFCRAYPPHTRVALTVIPGTTPVPGLERGRANYRCEPTNTPDLHDRRRGSAHLGGGAVRGRAAAGLATTISVEFKLRKSGNGSGRVTASGLDCGTVCSASFGFGKAIALTANPDDGSLFGGWNGVCARTQLTCTFPAGPITSIRAVFTRDAIAPTTPGVPVGRQPHPDEPRDLVGRVDRQRQGQRAIASTSTTRGRRDAGHGVHAGGPEVRPALRGRRGRGRHARQPLAAGERRRARRGRARSPRVWRASGSGASAGSGSSSSRSGRTGRRRLGSVCSAARGWSRAAGTASRWGRASCACACRERLPGGAYRLATTLVNPDGGTLGSRAAACCCRGDDRADGCGTCAGGAGGAAEEPARLRRPGGRGRRARRQRRRPSLRLQARLAAEAAARRRHAEDRRLERAAAGDVRPLPRARAAAADGT